MTSAGHKSNPIFLAFCFTSSKWHKLTASGFSGKKTVNERELLSIFEDMDCEYMPERFHQKDFCMEYCENLI